MRNSLYLLLMVLIFSCSEKKPVYYEQASNNLYGDDNTTTVTEEELTVVGKILQGEHRVRNLKETNDYLYFQWESNNKQWITSKVPLTKVRYQHSDVNESKVRFKWVGDCCMDDIEKIMEKRVVYILLITNENE
jgi:hypothetical protein